MFGRTVNLALVLCCSVVLTSCGSQAQPDSDGAMTERVDCFQSSQPESIAAFMLRDNAPGFAMFEVDNVQREVYRLDSGSLGRLCLQTTNKGCNVQLDSYRVKSPKNGGPNLPWNPPAGWPAFRGGYLLPNLTKFVVVDTGNDLVEVHALDEFRPLLGTFDNISKAQWWAELNGMGARCDNDGQQPNAKSIADGYLFRAALIACDASVDQEITTELISKVDRSGHVEQVSRRELSRLPKHCN
jgi:hypothetical protein